MQAYEIIKLTLVVEKKKKVMTNIIYFDMESISSLSSKYESDKKVNFVLLLSFINDYFSLELVHIYFLSQFSKSALASRMLGLSSGFMSSFFRWTKPCV